ncbi:MAG TPA: crosslink repair DNA glycosylase YcaQ family protein [Gaiella sp.]|nr:crosslink repair DNA glycosylase YcaQ family protein [Gaiella sp.]
MPETVRHRFSVPKPAGARWVDEAEARRIAVRSQLLDGSATNVLDTVRCLGFLQLDPIATIAPAQHLVLWSRLGAYDVAELDRLLWEERALFEWDALVWPIEELPLVRGLTRRWRTSTHYKSERWVRDFLAENRAFRRYVLRELERNGPLPSRALEDRSLGEREERRWYGSRNVGLMLTSLHLRGEVAVAGRADGQRLWDLADRWLPQTEALPLREAERRLAERRFRALGVRSTANGWEAHPDATDGDVPDRVTLLSPFDRLIHDRDRTEALFGFHYRLEMFVPKAKRGYGYYVLPILRGTELIGRIEPVFDRHRRALSVLGAWAEPGAPADTGRAIRGAVDQLAAWLGAESVVVGRRVPRAWATALSRWDASAADVPTCLAPHR